MGVSKSMKLDACVKNLKSISRNLSSKSPPQIADLYLAAIGLLVHLKKDQAALHELKRKDQTRCPPPKDIPAITAVLQDPALFEALISCLRVSGGSSGNETDGGRLHNAAGHHHHGINSRKRTNSIPNDDLHASKAIKLSHSPTPAAARLFGSNRNHTNAADASNANSEFNPTLNVRVISATILYMSFAHLDHWPVPLVKAYAQDCFGPRLWVDDENCKQLVENLRLVHSNNNETTNSDDGDAEMTDATVLEDAARVCDSYNRVLEFLAEDEAESNSNSHQLSPTHQAQVRRGSMSSVSSSGAAAAGPLIKKSNSKDDSVVGNGSRDKKASKRKTPKANKKSTSDDGASSSSGEEDEEVIVTKRSAEDAPAASSSSSPTKKSDERQGSPTGSHLSSEVSSPPKRRLYPLIQQKMNLQRVRQRYFGVNHENAHVAISSALSERLDSKAKQNSALLQSLHSFTSVAGVRNLIAGNLEKWLQSPGLSGLARTLFSSTVTSMENVEPPKSDDLEAIQKILAMRLKANQLSLHIENITTVASTIPTGTVAQQMYHQLLSEVLATMGNGADTSASDRLKMVGAVYSALPKDISAAGIAASLLMFIGESPGSTAEEKKKVSRKKLVKQLKHLLQLVAQQLGAAFDACKLLESLSSGNVKDRTWTLEDEEDRARLMYQCALLLVPALPKDARTKATRKGAELPDSDAEGLRKKLTQVRKLILTWFCTEYGPQFKGSDPISGDIGAGYPDFRSVLGGVDGTKLYPSWLKIARCLMFMENGDSVLMQQFVRGGKIVDDKDGTWNEEKYRIDRCYDYGGDFDDDMMWIVLKSASQEDGGIEAEIALTLLEHLFECCNIHRRGSLKLSDIMLAWELYSLVFYEPPETVLMLQNVSVGKASQTGQTDAPGSRFDDAEEDLSAQNTVLESVRVNTEDLDLPQLAYPGMWWRVTILALVMCGVAPQQIGAPVWEEHPTLRAMIKMVISSRYRFPTVDCDENDRAEMKKAEQLMRDEEAKIAELLFLPPKPPPKKEPDSEEHTPGRNRSSARQQQKRERAQRKRREKEAAEALAEEKKRKKMLRDAQKTIILWDPTSSARKPPRQAAELLVAVDSHFSLSKTFQRNVEPDFLLMTIGKTTRGAIERAYDWLIPIISNVPDTIARLHASASCVLLLRAYGTEGDERAQLKQLSSPLLHHVRESITGRFGQADAVRAFDLLMSDVASHNPDRRRCARRVLFDAIGKLTAKEGDGKASPWMLNILQLEHAKWLVGDAIKHMSTAISFERGLVLRNLLMALDDLIAYGKKHEVVENLDFATIVISLISSRPSVCAEALDRFSDLRTLGVRTVYKEFESFISDSSRADPTNGVVIKLFPPSQEKEVTLSLSLLQAASVLLSIWTDTNSTISEEGKGSPTAISSEQEATAFITNLANMLLHPIDASKGDDGEKEAEKGLASATMSQSGKSAVSVESWIMLAKARSNVIARRAALTAPTGFLPRLLLCSGLPRASLLTMIDRLGKLGDASGDQDSVFARLLVPSATSEWDVGRLGNRREVARKLLGRLSAYVRMDSVSFSNENTAISMSFLGWLSRECSANEKPKKHKPKSKSKAATKGLASLTEASSVLSSIEDSGPSVAKDFFGNAEESLEMDEFRPWTESQTGLDEPPDSESLQSNAKKAIEENQPDQLESLLQKPLEDVASGDLHDSEKSSRLGRLASVMLQAFLALEHKQDSIVRIVLTSVPYLSRLSGCPELWKVIFSKQDEEVEGVLDTLLGRCLECWCPKHISSCYEWLLSGGKSTVASNFGAHRVIRFLLIASGQQSVHMEAFSAKVTVDCVKNWGKSEDFVSASIAFATEAMKKATSDEVASNLLSRNELPDWLILVLSLAKCGRVQMKFICETVLKRISQPTDDLSLPLLRAVFLRLYVANPHGMNLGTAMIRSVLMEAAAENAVAWVDWRSPLDDQLQDMLDAVMSGTGQRLVRPLGDISKKHPLLILRKSHIMTEFLEKDALVGAKFVGNRPPKEPRGVIHGHSLAGPLNAVLSGKLVKVHLRHWGFSYTEFIWISFLDILCSIPGPVLFGCGLSMGFLDFLNVNMRLMYVQSQLRRNERDTRLKDKLKDILGTFRKSSRSGWEKWMASTNHGLPTLGEMRNVMICCGILDPKDVVKQP